MMWIILFIRGFIGLAANFQCPDLTPATFMDLSQTEGWVNDNPVKVTCDEGYILDVGVMQKNITCVSVGTEAVWNDTVGTCTRRQCPPVTDLVSNKQKTPEVIQQMFYGDTVNISCKDDYAFSVDHTLPVDQRVEASRVSTCEAVADWSTIGACSLITCEAPPVVPSSLLTNTNQSIHSTALYTCLSGHAFSGYRFSVVATCNGSAMWETPSSYGVLEYMSCAALPFHLGCLEAGNLIPSTEVDTTSNGVTFCRGHCLTAQERFAGVHNSTCYCGDELTVSWTDVGTTQCDQMCPGYNAADVNQQVFCGGTGGQVAVYTTLHGCYESLDLNGLDNVEVPEVVKVTCERRCKGLDHRFAIIHGGNRCTCANTTLFATVFSVQAAVHLCDNSSLYPVYDVTDLSLVPIESTSCDGLFGIGVRLNGEYYLNAPTRKEMCYFKDGTICDSEWIGYDGHCYRFHNDTVFDFASATTLCHSEDADVVSIMSPDELAFLRQARTVFSDLGPSGDDTKQTWLGLVDSRQAFIYTWVDGNVLKFSNWHADPVPSNTPINCVYDDSNEDKYSWAAVDCASTKNVICKKPAGTVPETQPASRTTIFTVEEEGQLAGYILDMANCGFGLGVHDICAIAFEMAERLNKISIFNKEKREAGYEWYTDFMKRHPQLSLRKPEGLSSVRATMLNQHVVSSYFQVLIDTLGTMKITDQAARIYNVDKTGISTVHQPGKIVGLKGKKAIHSKTSADRGENVTAVVCMSAAGHYIPPMVIFKGKRLNQGLISNGPPGTLFATSKSSFIDRELFENWFNHFIENLPAARPVLLVLDGHASHMSLSTLKLAKQNDITLMCLPPHTTSELQPLDKCLFKPLKMEYSKACVRFLKENPGRVVTRYDFCQLFRIAYTKVCNMQNATSAFKATGICPLNPNAISPEVLLPSTTTVLISENASDGHVTTSTALPDQAKPGPSSQLSETNVAIAERTMDEPAGLPSSVQLPSSVTSSVATLFKVPKAYKEVNTSGSIERKSQKVLSARCLTETDFIRQLEEKEEETRKKFDEKEQRKKEREERKLEKENKNRNKPSGKGKQKADTKRKQNPRDEPANFCGHCDGYYFDDTSDDEDWVKCTNITCASWFHESCTGMFCAGLQGFKCPTHV